MILNLNCIFFYKDIKERWKAISMTPPQEEVDNLELDEDLDLVSPADLYLVTGDVCRFINNKWKSACNDWKVSKKLSN